MRSILNDSEQQYLGDEQTFMSSCLECHACGGGTVKGIFTFDQKIWVSYAKLTLSDLRLHPVSAEDEIQRTKTWKQERHDGRLLKSWMDIDQIRFTAHSK